MQRHSSALASYRFINERSKSKYGRKYSLKLDHVGKDTQEFQQKTQYVFHCIYYFFGNRIFPTIYLTRQEFCGIVFHYTLCFHSTRETKAWILFLSPVPHVSTHIKVTHKPALVKSLKLIKPLHAHAEHPAQTPQPQLPPHPNPPVSLPTNK